MAGYYPINIDPTQFGLDEELKKLEELRRRTIKPSWSDVFMGLGSTLRSVGSGGRIPDNAAGIIQQGRENAQAEYERQLELQQREQALRYIAKTNNPDLMAAYQAGMDPSSIIKFNYQEKMAEKQRGWDLEDAKTKHQWSQEDAATAFANQLKAIDYTQKAQLANDPTLTKWREQQAQNAAFFKSLGLGAGDTTDLQVDDAGNTSAVPLPRPMPTSDTGPTPSFSPTAQVDEFTDNARKVFQLPNLTRPQAQILFAAAQAGPEKLAEALTKVQELQISDFNSKKPITAAPNTTFVDPVTRKPMFVTDPAPLEVPADIRTAEALRKDPGLFEIYKGMKQSGSGATMPEDAIWQKAGEKMVQEVFPKLTERGGVIAASEPQFQSMKKLLESAPQGLNWDALASEYLPGYSGSAATLKSIVFNLAPRERVEGSGSTSDIEYAGMLKSYPNLLNLPMGNKAILSILEAKRNIEREKAEVVSEYNSKDISYTKAIKEINRINQKSILDGVPQEVKDLVAAESKPDSSAGPMPQSAKDAGFTDQEWNALTPAERQSLE